MFSLRSALFIILLLFDPCIAVNLFTEVFFSALLRLLHLSKPVRCQIRFCSRSGLLCTGDMLLWHMQEQHTVLHPVCPSLCRRYAALSYARITEEVKSGLESSFRLYSIRCLFSFSQPVTPLLSTNPPCGIPL